MNPRRSIRKLNTLSAARQRQEAQKPENLDEWEAMIAAVRNAAKDAAISGGVCVVVSGEWIGAHGLQDTWRKLRGWKVPIPIDASFRDHLYLDQAVELGLIGKQE